MARAWRGSAANGQRSGNKRNKGTKEQTGGDPGRELMRRSRTAELVDAGVLGGSGDVTPVVGAAEVDALDVAIGDRARLK
jgi:hypothetical protein